MAHSYSPPLTSEFRREITGITSLRDVHITPPLNDKDTLVYNSLTQNFNNTPLELGVLTDVKDSLAPTDNQVLTYSAINSQWEAKDPSGAAPIAFNDLTDVVVSKTAGDDGKIIVYDHASGTFIQKNEVEVNAITSTLRTNGNGGAVVVESAGTANQIVLRPDADPLSVAVISVINKSAAQYATDITTYLNPDATIPNKLYVDNTVSTAVANVALNDLTNVTAPTPADNDLLQYDTSTSKWINVPSSILDKNLNDLTDVVITGPVSTGSRLEYDSVNWINVPADPPKEKYATSLGTAPLSHTVLNQKKYPAIDAGLAVGFSAVGDTLTYVGTGVGKFFKFVLTGSIYQSVPDSRIIAFVEQNASKVGGELVSYSKTSSTFAEDSGALSVLIPVSNGDIFKIAIENLENIVTSNPDLFLTIEEF